MTINYLAGLPRSGSTLLGNVLAQHPDMKVTGTSPLYACIHAFSEALSGSPDVVSELTNVPESYDRYLDSLRSFMATWHPHTHVLDKHRAWPGKLGLIKQLDETSQIVCCVRDPRDVVASLLRQEYKTALFNSPVNNDMKEYASQVMSPEGMVGAPIKLMEDLLTRQAEVLWVRYEDFSTNPSPILKGLVEAMGLTEYIFDLENIENIATDLDPMYRNKYPHVGSGSLRPPSGNWSDVYDEELANLISSVYPRFMSRFNYR